MTNRAFGNRFVAILWFVAAALAFIAVAIPFFRDTQPNWAVAAGGLFCVAMGIAEWSRSRRPPPRA